MGGALESFATHIGALALRVIEVGAGGAALNVATGAGAVRIVPVLVLRLFQALVARICVLALAAAQVLAVLLIRIAILGLDAAVALAFQMLLHADNGRATFARRPKAFRLAHTQLQRLHLGGLARDQCRAAAAVAAIDARAGGRVIHGARCLLPALCLSQRLQLHDGRLGRAARWRRIAYGSYKMNNG